MKNFIRTLAFVAIMLFSFGFPNQSKAEAYKMADCPALMENVYLAYVNSGYSESEAFQAANWAYEGCVSNGGNPGGVIIHG